ncbi:MAG TPA: hypothetical protein VH351_15500 [Bryobacteraceae bacterium]|jgi:hypothetical protein|nr:hypothetical protein [Bryobacteraceae bacterium]
MAVLDDARRWIKDQFVTDEHVTMTPKAALRQLETALVDLSPGERQRNIEHLRHYADSYYLGRHRETVPREVLAAFSELTREATRLNAVDRARELVASYGGPPTRQTLADSLERSARQRALRLENAAAPQHERVSAVEAIGTAREHAATVPAPLRAHSKEVVQHVERVPNAPGETVSRAVPESNLDRAAKVQTQRGNRREMAQEQGLGMGV